MVSPAPVNGHAFLSYVHEDSATVDRIERILTLCGVKVWRDKNNLWPGEDWKAVIKAAIKDDSLAFIACFSPASVAREKSYQNEEMILAVEEFRLRPPGRSWLVPVRLGDCVPPEYELGAGRSLGSLQRVDLFGEAWDSSIVRLTQTIQRILGGHEETVTAATGPPITTPPLSITATIKSMLLEPSRAIELEDFVQQLATTARNSLIDETEFPTHLAQEVAVGDGAFQTRYLADLCLKYWTVVQPTCEALVVGCTWGTPEQNAGWARATKAVATAAAAHRTGSSTLVNLREFAALPLIYAVGLACVARGRYGALKAILLDVKVKNDHNESIPLVERGHTLLPFQNGTQGLTTVLAKLAEGLTVEDGTIRDLSEGRGERRLTPISDALFALLHPLFDDIVVDDDEYEDLFDRTEVLLALMATDVKLQVHQTAGRYAHGAWFGRFTWKGRYGTPIEVEVTAEALDAGDSWPPLAAGLFGGSDERLKRAVEAFLPQAELVRRNRF